MMLITPHPALKEAILHYINETMERGHSLSIVADNKPYERHGVHGSDLIFCNLKALYKRWEKPKDVAPERTMLYFMGHACQFYLFPEHQKHSQCYVVDDISITPDFVGYSFGRVDVRLGEMKSTRSSMKRFDLEKQEHYLMQMKAECRVVGEKECDFIAVFVCGDYNPPFPAIDCWKCIFTPEEIDSNWKELLRRKTILEEAIADGDWPREIIRYDWECKWCDYPDCPERRV